MNTVNATTDIKTFSSFEETLPYGEQICTLYKNVFGDRIWNEGVKGSAEDCEFKAAFEDTPEDGKCADISCKCPLIDFYTPEEIIQDLQSLFKKDCAFVLGLSNDVPIGFYWGWNATLSSLNEEKLDLSSPDFSRLNENIQKYFPSYIQEDSIFYSAETGITPSMRGQRISIRLFNEAINAQLEEKKSLLVLSRTSRNSPQWKIREQQGFILVYDYNDQDKRGLFLKQFTR